MYYLYYGMEAWILKGIDIRRLEAFEMLYIPEYTGDFLGGKSNQRDFIMQGEKSKERDP